MTTINAGSTLVNQYAPPFVISDSVTTNWQLRYNANILAFEAFDPSENVIVSGFDSIEVALFPVVAQQTFVVPWESASKQSLIITIDGVKQQQDAYDMTTNTGSGTTTVTLSDVVGDGGINMTDPETVEIVGLQADGGASIELFGPYNVDYDVPNTAQTNFDLSWLAPTEQSLIVTLDGVKQATSAYSIVPNATATDTILTFSETPIMIVSAATNVLQGTLYSVNDILTVVEGTKTVAAAITVDAVQVVASGEAKFTTAILLGW